MSFMSALMYTERIFMPARVHAGMSFMLGLHVEGLLAFHIFTSGVLQVRFLAGMLKRPVLMAC